jgi:hypothetical protein
MLTKLSMLSAILDGSLIKSINALQAENQALVRREHALIQELRTARAERDGARRIIGAVRRRDLGSDEHF